MKKKTIEPQLGHISNAIALPGQRFFFFAAAPSAIRNNRKAEKDLM